MARNIEIYISSEIMVGSFEPTFFCLKGSSLNCIKIIALTKVYGYPGLETVVWYIIFSLIKSLKNRKTAYLGTKTFRRTNSGGFGYAGNQY